MDQGTYKSYIAGFVLSIMLTFAAYFSVAHPESLGLAGAGAIAILAIILGLAVIQLIVQMLFFLHVGAEPGRSWKLIVFFATLGLVLIIVVGSLWIMNHLNYAMMVNPAAMQQYMQDQQGF